MKRKKLFWIILVALLIISALLVTELPVKSPSNSPKPTPSNLVTLDKGSLVIQGELTPTPSKNITDLSPELAEYDKATIIISYPDGSRMMFLISPEMIDDFISKLPNDNKIDVVIPPQSLIGHQSPLETVVPGEEKFYYGTDSVVGTQPSIP